jgi:hypothetical protein
MTFSITIISIYRYSVKTIELILLCETLCYDDDDDVINDDDDEDATTRKFLLGTIFC